VEIYIDDIANITVMPNGSVISALSEGIHNITIKSIDFMGNVGVFTQIFTVDTLAPIITITSPDSTAYTQDSLAVTYTVSESGFVTVYVDNIANITNFPSGSVLSSLLEGNHNLTIVASDLFGNNRKESVLFTVDTIVPFVTITSPANLTYTQDYVTLTYSVSEGTVTIYINEIANTTILSSETTLSFFSNGIINLTIVAVDSAGNYGHSTVIFTINVQTTTTLPISTTTTTTPASTTTSTQTTTTTTNTVNKTTSKKSTSYISVVSVALILSLILIIKRSKRK